MGKIEPNLQHEIDRVEAAGQAERTIPTLIECVPRITATDAGASGLESMEAVVHELQTGLLAQLGELGAVRVEPLTFVNAVAAELTPAQIRAVASRSDVDAVRLGRAEHVTAGTD